MPQKLCKSLKSRTEPNHKLESRNPIWRQKLKGLSDLAQSELTVLLLGESGVGKEVIARILHDCSSRRKGPFISVNCSALNESLVESELFGHVQGSFTGASYARKGAFEAARGGTLFLDEIGDLPLSLQPKLLRALENNEIRPVGSDRCIKTDVRVLSATHENLRHLIAESRFRTDLFFRLNIVSVAIPALRERMEDFNSLLREFCFQYRVQFSSDAISELKKYVWPGNIRELKNTVARASALFREQAITADKVPSLIDHSDLLLLKPQETRALSHIPFIRELEREMITQRLFANKGNQRRTAEELGIPKSTLHDRIRTYDIQVEDLRSKKGIRVL